MPQICGNILKARRISDHTAKFRGDRPTNLYEIARWKKYEIEQRKTMARPYVYYSM